MANTLPRHLLKWLLSLDLSCPIKNVKRDLANGFLVAEVLSKHYPHEIHMHSFENVTSQHLKMANWRLLDKFYRRHEVCISRSLIEAVASATSDAATELIQILYDFVQNPEGASPSGKHEMSSHSEQAQVSSPGSSPTSFPSQKLPKVRFSLEKEQDENFSDPRAPQNTASISHGSLNTWDSSASGMWTDQPKTSARPTSNMPIQPPTFASEQPIQQQSLPYQSSPPLTVPNHIPAYAMQTFMASPDFRAYSSSIAPFDALPVKEPKAGNALYDTGQGPGHTNTSRRTLCVHPMSFSTHAAFPHGSGAHGNPKAHMNPMEHTSCVPGIDPGASGTGACHPTIQHGYGDAKNFRDGYATYPGPQAAWPTPYSTGWGPWGTGSGTYQGTNGQPPQWEAGGANHTWPGYGDAWSGRLGPQSRQPAGPLPGTGTVAVPRFEYDRQPRPVDFKPYTVTDYRLREYDVKLQSGYWTLGTLGGKADEADVQAKREHLEKLKELGRAFRQKNLQSAARGTTQGRPRVDASPARDSARARAREYVKSVKKPSMRPQPAPSGAGPQGAAYTSCDASRRRGNNYKTPKDPPFARMGARIEALGSADLGNAGFGNIGVVSREAASRMASGEEGLLQVASYGAAGFCGEEDIDSLVRAHALHRERVSELCSRLLTKVSLKAD
eukprot:jgi/Botrbrau1/10296/Bobra.0120s0014.1